MTHRNYSINDYDPHRAELFANEASHISSTGIHFSQIDHIGSTSIPGMRGKQTIDILCVVKSSGAADKAIPLLEDIGYLSLGHVHDDKGYILEKNIHGNRLYIIHLLPENHHSIREALALKKYLLQRPDEVKAYSECKDRLFSQFANDYKMYRKEKNEFMKALKERAFKRADGLEYAA